MSRSFVSTDRFTSLLIASTIGVYVLLIAGATTTLTGAAAACPTWPGCNGEWMVAVDNPALAVAWGHRVIAAVVAALVALVTVASWLGDAPRRVRFALSGALALYPVQVVLGALTLGGAEWVSRVHLLLAMGIFAGLIAALAWTLNEYPAPRIEAASPSRVKPPAAVPTGRVRRYLAAYWSLMKPRLMWLLCLVAAAGMALAAGPDLSLRTVVATLTGGVLAIGASGTFNHVIERDRDAKMQRTADRPLATDVVSVRHALAFGLVLSAASLGAFLTINRLAAALGLTAIVFYSVIYTVVLKPNTVQNTVIGGFAGALPALIGWAAVTETIGLPALALAGVIFLWTPAHFYNLAIAYRDDYERGGFPMMPVVRGDRLTRRHIVYWLGATLIGATALAAVTELGVLYAVTSVLFGAVFLYAVVALHRDHSKRTALRAFHASNAFLGAVLVAVLVDALAF